MFCLYRPSSLLNLLIKYNKNIQGVKIKEIVPNSKKYN